MEVTVSTSRGKQIFALDPSWTITHLKHELHTRLSSLNVPIPEEQKLISSNGRLLEIEDGNEAIGSLCQPGDDLVVLPRRRVPPLNDPTAFPPRETAPAVTLAQVNAAIKEENERLAAAGEPPPPPAPARAAPAAAAAAAANGDRLEGSIRALVEGNFEQLRGYLEQLQEAVSRQGIGGEDLLFELQGGGMDDDEDDDEDGHGDEEGDEGMNPEDGALAPPPPPPRIPDPDPAALNELVTMGFPEQLCRNALLLHRNRLQAAVEWALNHMDDPQAQEPLTDEALAAVYGPGRGPRGAAGLVRRRPRLPPGQVDPGALDSMVEMGFNRDDSARALAFTSNSLEDACQLLLSGMPLPPLPEQVAVPAGEAGATGQPGAAGEAANVAAAPGEAAGGAAIAGGPEAQAGGGAGAAPGENILHHGVEGEGEEEEEGEGMEESSDEDGDDDDGAWEYDGMGGMGLGLGVGNVNIDDLEMMYGGGGMGGGNEWIGYSDDDGTDDDEEYDDDEYDDFEGEYSDGEAMEEQEGGGGGGAVAVAVPEGGDGGGEGAEADEGAPSQGQPASSPAPAPASASAPRGSQGSAWAARSKMVLKTQTCRFSGLKIYPGKGMLFIRVDGQQFLFLKQKCKSMFNQRKRPAKIAWTVLYRKQHRKDLEQQVARKKRRNVTRAATRSVGGASLEVIAKKKAEKPEARKASREAALREIKERAKKAKADKAAEKAAARASGKAVKNVPRGAGKAGAKSTGR